MSVKLTLIVFLFFYLIIGSTLAGSTQTRSIEIKNDNVEIRDHTLTGTSDFLPHNKAIKKTSTEVVSSSILSQANLDLDGDQIYDALTDGLLILRSMFGLTGDELISAAISDSAVYSSAEDIELRFDQLEKFLDVDDNGVVDALTDGLIILRYLFGLTGENLISNVIASEAQRSDAYEISSYVGQLARLDVEACSNSLLRFYQMSNKESGVSFSLEGEDKDFFEVSSDGFLSFRDSVPSSSQDGDDIFEVGIKRAGSNIDDEIRWLSITVVPGYVVEVMQLFPGKNSLLTRTGNTLIAKGVLYSPSRALTTGDISDFSVNSILVTDTEEINGDIFWSVDLDKSTSSISLTAEAKCNSVADSYTFYKNESDVHTDNPFSNDIWFDEENNRLFGSHKNISRDHYYVSYDLTTSELSYFMEISKYEKFVSNHGYETHFFTLNPNSSDIFSSRRDSTGTATVYRMNIDADQITRMEQTQPRWGTNDYNSVIGPIVPTKNINSKPAWVMAGTVWSYANQFYSGIMTMTINPNTQNNGVFSPSHYFDVQSYIPREELGVNVWSRKYYGFLVDPQDGSIILSKQLPDEVKPWVMSGRRINSLNGRRYVDYRTDNQNQIKLYDLDTFEQTVLVDFDENPPPDLSLLSGFGLQITNDGNSVYLNSLEKLTRFDVLTKKYEVILNGFGDPDNALYGKLMYNIVAANNNETIVTTYGYECEYEENIFGAKKIAAIELKSGFNFYDEVLGCDSGTVHKGYNKENSVLLIDEERVVSLNLNNGSKTTVISLSEEITSIDLDENDSKLYILTPSRIYILDMNSKTLISSEELDVAFQYPQGISKANTSSAIYVSFYNSSDGTGSVFEFNEDLLASEPIKVFDGIDIYGSTMKLSEAFNSLYFSAWLPGQSQTYQYILKSFNLNDATWTDHEVYDGASQISDLIIDDNYGVIYFKVGSALYLHDITDTQTSLIIN